MTPGEATVKTRGPLNAPPPIAPLSPEELRARVLHIDPEVLVFDKPAGLAVHAAGPIQHHLGCYMTGLAFDADEAPRLAHRLDRDTAGCLVLGRTAGATARLGRLFAGGGVAKTYWAVSDGIPPEPQGVIDLPLRKFIVPGSWTIAPDPAGQPAVTAYRVLATAGGRAWLELEPRTGRTHQIRVHCAAIGCPLLGEPYYGPSRQTPGALHLLARAVAFRLAADQPAVAATAPPPAHMAAALARLGYVAG
jgi:tRNA pseudouridine32 synthase/23S rRNA pseudouridine746 synthase